MTQEIYLNPDQVFDLEPSEGNERHRVWLSPFAVPRVITLKPNPTDGVFSIEFEYAGREAASPAELLDDRYDPAVSIQVAVHTHKVLAVKVANPDHPPDLLALAERLRAAAVGLDNPGRRLSYRMTAAILQDIGRLDRPPFGTN